MGTLLRPAGDVPISSSWADHVNRQPPSSEPGTDYACAYGTTIVAGESGTIVDRKTSNGSATGRYVTIALDNGWTLRILHLSSVLMDVGVRVVRGAPIAVSGASGYGSDWYYGPHAHATDWHSAIWSTPTVDYETDVGSAGGPAPTPIRLDEPMILIETVDGSRAPLLIAAGWEYWPEGTEYLDAARGLADRTLAGNARQYDLWLSIIQNGTQHGFPGQGNPQGDDAS